MGDAPVTSGGLCFHAFLPPDGPRTDLFAIFKTTWKNAAEAFEACVSSSQPVNECADNAWKRAAALTYTPCGDQIKFALFRDRNHIATLSPDGTPYDQLGRREDLKDMDYRVVGYRQGVAAYLENNGSTELATLVDPYAGLHHRNMAAKIIVKT